jgi:hypothetical protein
MTDKSCIKFTYADIIAATLLDYENLVKDLQKEVDSLKKELAELNRIANGGFKEDVVEEVPCMNCGCPVNEFTALGNLEEIERFCSNQCRDQYNSFMEDMWWVE